jgi:hypothetical protein
MPTPSAWDDRVRVYGIPSRHPCLRARTQVSLIFARLRAGERVAIPVGDGGADLIW